ncbi:hypothetical protein BDF19DRAFT_450301 [Syncephalis fuscata]|nr:hypothetical protein BDF19DRAFT_450301 [Syncephalis fuscata]
MVAQPHDGGSSKAVETKTATSTTTTKTTTTITTSTESHRDAKHTATHMSKTGAAVLNRPPTGFLTASDKQYMFGVTIIALFIRSFYISHPHQVIFDETHAGGFMSQYINSDYFLDIDPPFGKLVLTAVAYLFGYDGKFDFYQAGASFMGTNVPYVEMRLFSAVIGALLSPIAYGTIKAANGSSTAALLASIMVVFGSYTVFRRYDEYAFTCGWWSWLVATSVNVASVISIKHSGLLLLTILGVATLGEFYRLLGDRRVGLCQLGKHFVARVISLFVIPATIYLFWFAVHFSLLQNHTNSASILSPELRSTLIGHNIPLEMPRDIAFGSEITIEHHQDIFNVWRVEQFHPPEMPYDQREPMPIYNGERVRLWHMQTNTRLHCHDHKAPVTENEHHKEVTAYGFPDFDGDSNDDWLIEVVDYNRDLPQSKNQIMAFYTHFRIRHANQGCYLSSHGAVLPSWGFGQVEVTCVPDGKEENLVWRIMSHKHPTMPADAPLWSKVAEAHTVMKRIHSPSGEIHPSSSRPSAWWPIVKTGISFINTSEFHIFVTGNLLIWLFAASSVFIWLGLQFILILRDQRGHKDTLQGHRSDIMGTGGFFIMGWFIYYVSYLGAEHQQFLHTYLPAFYFSILLSGTMSDVVFNYLHKKSSTISHALLFIFAVVVTGTFWVYSPWIYGLPVTRTYCERARLLSRWKWDCPAVDQVHSQ